MRQRLAGSPRPSPMAKKRGRRRAVALILAAVVARQVLRARRKISFAGRTVLITGGSRGLGLVLARLFASEGATLALCARDPAELQRAEEAVTATGARVHTFVCDVGNADQVRRVIQSVQAEIGA